MAGRNALVALLLFAGSFLAAYFFGALGGLAGVLAALWLLPRRPEDSALLEAGALSGWVCNAPTLGACGLAIIGVLGLVALQLARLGRGRADVRDGRIWGIAAGFVAVCVARWLHVPELASATTWLLLCGWVSSVALGLFTEGFAPRSRTASGGLARDTSLQAPPNIPPISFGRRAIARGGVGRTALSAGLATLVDFLVFHALLEVLVPGLATLVGSIVGGLLNFGVNRRWAFDSHGSLTSNAARYMWVSAASALLNAAAVSLALLEPSVSPIAAWLVARALSFLGWNYPMQRDHVFSHRGTDGTRLPSAEPPSSRSPSSHA